MEYRKTGYTGPEKSACGVGFLASRKGQFSHDHLQHGLNALRCVEHRGACAADQITGDGAGIMTDIPFELFGYERDSVAVATIFVPKDAEQKRIALRTFEDTFQFEGLKVIDYREVPVDHEVLGPEAMKTVPDILHAFIERPEECRTDFSFDKLLYAAKQKTRIKEKERGIIKQFFFVSLSAKTIIYKALTRADALDKFYLDLQNPAFKTRFVLFHRRFSTNTRTSWDKVQPFRLIGHNGEINTIAGNRSWANSREKILGVKRDQLLTHEGISDSGSLNEMIEALRYRSSIPHVEDTLALMIPPADQNNDFYKFWSRAMEPWDGPAFVSYCEGNNIGARLDRNGFRPCRWMKTDEHFYLSSETGTFDVHPSKIKGKGTLYAGRGVTVDLNSGSVHFRDPSHSSEHKDAKFDPRLLQLDNGRPPKEPSHLERMHLFNYTTEDLQNVLYPMILEGKEPIGSMGDTARLAILSDQPRSFFDFFYQNFSQVTNPPLDYIREKMVTDLTMYLGKKPNIFEPKELIPPAPAYELKSPVLSLGQMQSLYELYKNKPVDDEIKPTVFDITFKRTHGVIGFESRLRHLAEQAVEAAKNSHHVIILTDRNADEEYLPVPSLLALRTVINALNDSGLRLESSIVIDSAEIKNTHHAAAIIGFGATAICPYMILEIARYEENRKFKDLNPVEKEKFVLKALDNGILKIMAKSGISVVQSYQSAKLFTAIGLGPELIKTYFPGLKSTIGGAELEQIANMVLKNTEHLLDTKPDERKPIHTYLYKEHNRGTRGEKHSMTNTRSKMIHKLVRENEFGLESMELYDAYLKEGYKDDPVTLRHLFTTKKTVKPLPLEKVEGLHEITKRFGSGAMSFGAISAESQRDIFKAMKELGGRSNSGEGGENPYYYTEGVSATAKQVASARFGVTAEYIVSGEELQIKIAQGAKPGEGGQLMGVKVDRYIAKARHANEGIDLISPPPLHDIYSIEDLKELIYELKQVHPGKLVNVKLVSGYNIGTIAVGVAKAGADVIHVSGGEGGTGAASLSSMKHAGLPWELGLVEVHQALIENGLRKNVKLRTDGGLSTGKDIIMAAILGAEEYDFGKLLLIAEGCVMARICEKNTCPTGIATHDPKFKAKYKGDKDHVVRMMKYLAEDIRRHLSQMGFSSLKDIFGRYDLLEIDPRHRDLIEQKNLDLSYFLDAPVHTVYSQPSLFTEEVGDLNKKILDDTERSIQNNEDFAGEYRIGNTDRAVLATVAGRLAKEANIVRLKSIQSNTEFIQPFTSTLNFTFRGSAGQGFCVFQTEGINVKLYGDANDSVCKGMSGGKTVITLPEQAAYNAFDSAIIGNCALYGATGGTVYIHGQAGDRFAVRNSGATAVVEGTGLHACEYMTNGTVVILGNTSHNVGAGMTGGQLFILGDPGTTINSEYIGEDPMTFEDYDYLKGLLTDYFEETGSAKANYILNDWEAVRGEFKKFLPLGLLEKTSEPVPSREV